MVLLTTPPYPAQFGFNNNNSNAVIVNSQSNIINSSGYAHHHSNNGAFNAAMMNSSYSMHASPSSYVAAAAAQATLTAAVPPDVVTSQPGGHHSLPFPGGGLQGPLVGCPTSGASPSATLVPQLLNGNGLYGRYIPVTGGATPRPSLGPGGAPPGMMIPSAGGPPLGPADHMFRAAFSGMPTPDSADFGPRLGPGGPGSLGDPGNDSSPGSTPGPSVGGPYGPPQDPPTGGSGNDAQQRRELRLLKNREAAKECRRKKKEYVRCLENRVAVLERQNKQLIEELKTLKELYCRKQDS